MFEVNSDDFFSNMNDEQNMNDEHKYDGWPDDLLYEELELMKKFHEKINSGNYFSINLHQKYVF